MLGEVMINYVFREVMKKQKMNLANDEEGTLGLENQQMEGEVEVGEVVEEEVEVQGLNYY
jgi:hypothetical protein